MTSILRTRRSVHSSVSSLPSYIEHPAVCEDLPSLDDSTTSETEEDDYKIMECFPYRRNHEQELIARRRSFVVRALVLITILVLVATNVPSRANSQRAPIVQERRTTEFEQNDSAEMAVRRLTLEAESVQSLQVFSNQEKIRKRSRRKVKKMFGDGPYLVEFELLIWDGENRAKQHFFTVEMAPVNLMPASVLVFLQQVKLGLWSETSFHLNAKHVIAARPVSGDGQISKLERFEASGVGKMPFLEYSEGYPHLPYTLGFIGKGPAFYINKKHNLHQDACFANVVVGRSTIDTISQMRGLDSDPSRIRPITIKGTRIVQLDDLSDRAMSEYLQFSRRSR